MLRKCNFWGLRSEIDESGLSTSFRDAIKITRALGIPYLWIDALCIIHDSPNDWAHESEKMASYYKGGHVMISAFASPNANHGILRPRTVDHGSVKIPVDGINLFMRPILEDATCVIKAITDSEVRPSISVHPLNERAWTLQERLFAPRIIHYTNQQMIWQCKSCMASEDNQYDIRPKYPAPVNDLLNMGNKRLDFNGNPTSRSDIGSTGWYQLVRSYTSRNITCLSDILPGLSGLASEVHKITGAQYLAGLWDCKSTPDTFIRNLLWRVADDDGVVGGKPATLALNGSPSWSWASIYAEIDFRDGYPSKIARKSKIKPEIFLKDTTLATSNPFGQVKEGSIHLMGFVHSYTGPETFSTMRERQQAKRPPKLMDSDKEPRVDKHVCVNDDYCYTARGSEAILGGYNDDFPEEENSDGYAELRFAGDFLDDFVLDIPDLEYDWTSTRHLILFMGLWEDDDQWFLLLRSADNVDKYFTRAAIHISQPILSWLLGQDRIIKISG
jgi:hypothetical protein